MKIRDLIKNIDYEYLQGNLDEEVMGLSHDNRYLKPHEGFICISGTRFDSHDLIDEVVEKGASLLVVEKDVKLPEGVCAIKVASSRIASPLLAAAFYDHPARKMKTVAITGSKGKTTATHMMADIFRKRGFKCGTIGTNGAIMPIVEDAYKRVVNADLYKPLICEETEGYYVYELANTTPDAMEMQMYLALMVESGCTHVIIEVSSQAMKMHRVEGMEFDYGIWTNLDFTDHIGGLEHKDEDDLICCKANMINQSRIGFLNLDDKSLGRFESYLNKKNKLYYYGENPKADYVFSNVEKTFDNYPGIRFDVDGLTKGTVSVNLPGEFNVYNALPCVAIAQMENIGYEVINEALTHLLIRGRFEIVFDNGHFKVCVDFAHNGYSTFNHLKALREYRPKRVVCVFGADGNRSLDRRYGMGEASARLADLSIITSGHLRWETYEKITADTLTSFDKVEKEVGRRPKYLLIKNRQEAITYAIENAEEGDIITIIGLGHESWQEEKGVKYPHSDIDFVRETCKRLGL
ncbi:MAG: UDP-N-acetylmuramoyl-L-alanyl-D-glutamate--2,6-diaminopimelate ligase [Erysipelotrichaceae bacterium]|nr:UDP-N-acetylmuramoyl-L-alanyl-D-glutamate--2,6-diaminopimelate ligase [Erysipelotrichaceae bacterium]